ncbi:MAG: hypothetical protein ACI9KD_003076, partial [Congregibacter sp.]
GGRRSFERPSSASDNAEASLEMREQPKGPPPVSPTSRLSMLSSANAFQNKDSDVA